MRLIGKRDAKAAAFDGKVAIVTGASSGIGRAVALDLARQGARLVLAARRQAALEQVAADIQRLHGEAWVAPADVTHQADVERLIETTLHRCGRIDIVIANAGVYYRGDMATVPVEVFQQSLDVNFMGAVRPVLAALPHLLAQRSGHIVLVCSMDGKKGIRSDGPYVAAKYAMAGFGDVLRQDLRGTGVDVSIIFPGRVDTPMIDALAVPLISRPISADVVARAVVDAIRYRRAEVIVPYHARFLLYAHLFSPRLSDWAIQFFRLEGWMKGS
jgi:NADP-dependent 3-hydroxy acid dehydrogenase YdfG